MNILLAEDDFAVRHMLRAALDQAGHRVRAVECGDSVIYAALEEPPDALVLDCRMGAIDGIQSAYLLRKLRIPTLFISGDAEYCGVVSLSSAEFLAKPFTIVEFLDRVEALAAPAA